MAIPSPTLPRQRPEGKMRTCKHCGSEFKAHHEDDHYCCEGCSYVSHIISGHDWGHFYSLKGSAAMPPVGARVFEPGDLAWFAKLIEEAEKNGAGICETRCRLIGISCVGCIWLIEQVFRDQPGTVDIDIQAETGDICISWERGALDAIRLAESIIQIGYGLAPPADDPDERSKATQGLITRIGVCGFLLLNTMLFTLPSYLGMDADFQFARLFSILAALFAACSLAVGGSLFINRAVQGLKHRILHMDLPIALGLTAAWIGSMIGWLSGFEDLVYFDFVATFVFLMLLGRWLQEAAIEHNQRHLRKQDIKPDSVIALGGSRDGESLPAESIRSEASYILEPGKINPVTADLLDAATTVSLEWINGEAEPVLWKRGTPLPAGAQLVSLRPLRVRAKEDWQHSTLAKLLASERTAFHHKRLQKILTWYIGVVLMIAVFSGSAWLASGASVLTGFQVALSVLVVSCPCALGVTLPFIDELAITALRRRGVFIKSQGIWEKLNRVKTIVFDKTGTLSLDTPLLKNPENLGQLEPKIRTVLFHLVQTNPHPTARSLKQALLGSFPQLSGTEHLGHIPESIGKGVWVRDQQLGVVSLGRQDWAPFHETAPKNQRGDAQVVLRQNGQWVAGFCFAEYIRDDARESIEAIQASGHTVALLSGDADERVAKIADHLGINPGLSRARCTPDTKAAWIEENAPGSAMMIGDGANDRLAIDQAICTGTPAVDRSILEGSADFFFFGRSLRGIPDLLRLGALRDRTSTQVLVLAVIYNLMAISLCAIGYMHPLIAAIAMPISSIATLAWATWRFKIG
ncbi:MAG: HAD-IC family P-type ATPase [Opitutales bacterium]|nr:HAD-IC family P-type ATPase [Opitutales bacterium]